jgi:epoxyqueuosine reductase QueG
MLSKTDVIQAALENGFEDVGFTTADPFENSDERVLGMIAWALGKIGGKKSKRLLERFSAKAYGLVSAEINSAQDMLA